MKIKTKTLKRKETVDWLINHKQILVPMNGKTINAKRLSKIAFDAGIVVEDGEITQKTLKYWESKKPQKLEKMNELIKEKIIKGSITSWGIIPTNDLIVFDVDLTKGEETADLSIIDVMDIKATYFNDTQFVMNRSKHGFRFFGINKNHLKINQTVKNFNLQFVDHMNTLINFPIDIRGGENSSLLAMQNSNRDYSNLLIIDDDKPEPVFTSKILDDEDYSRPYLRESVKKAQERLGESQDKYTKAHVLFNSDKNIELNKLRFAKQKELIEKMNSIEEQIKKEESKKALQRKEKTYTSKFYSKKSESLRAYVYEQFDLIIKSLPYEIKKNPEKFIILDVDEQEQMRIFRSVIINTIERVTDKTNQIKVKEIKKAYPGKFKNRKEIIKFIEERNSETIKAFKQVFEKIAMIYGIDDNKIDELFELSIHDINRANNLRIRTNHLIDFPRLLGGRPIDFDIKNANDFLKDLGKKQIEKEYRYDYLGRHIKNHKWIKLVDAYKKGISPELSRLISKDKLFNSNTISNFDKSIKVSYDGYSIDEINAPLNDVVYDSSLLEFMNPRTGLNNYKKYAIKKVTGIEENQKSVDDIIKDHMDIIEPTKKEINKEFLRLINKLVQVKKNAFHHIRIARLYEHTNDHKLAFVVTYIFDSSPETIDRYDEPHYNSRNFKKDHNLISIYRRRKDDEHKINRDNLVHVGNKAVTKKPDEELAEKNPEIYEKLMNKYLKTQYVDFQVKENIKTPLDFINYVKNDSEVFVSELGVVAAFLHEYSSLTSKEIFKLCLNWTKEIDLDSSFKLSALRFIKKIILDKTYYDVNGKILVRVANYFNINKDSYSKFFNLTKNEHQEKVEFELNQLKLNDFVFSLNAHDLMVSDEDYDLKEIIKENAKEHLMKTGELFSTLEGQFGLFILQNVVHLTKERFSKIATKEQKIYQVTEKMIPGYLKLFFSDTFKYSDNRDTKEFDVTSIQEKIKQNHAKTFMKTSGKDFYIKTLKNNTCMIEEGERDMVLYIMASIGLRLGIEKEELIELLTDNLYPRFEDGFPINQIRYQVEKMIENTNTSEGYGYYISNDNDVFTQKYFNTKVSAFFSQHRDKKALKKTDKKNTDNDQKFDIIVPMIFNKEYRSGNFIFKFNTYGYDLLKTPVKDIPVDILKKLANQVTSVLQYKYNVDRKISYQGLRNILQMIESLRNTSNGFNYKDKYDIYKNILNGSGEFYGDISSTFGSLDNYQEYSDLMKKAYEYINWFDSECARFGKLIPDEFTTNSSIFKKIADKTVSENHKAHKGTIVSSSISFMNNSTKDLMTRHVHEDQDKINKEVVKKVRSSKHEMNLQELQNEGVAYPENIMMMTFFDEVEHEQVIQI